MVKTRENTSCVAFLTPTIYIYIYIVGLERGAQRFVFFDLFFCERVARRFVSVDLFFVLPVASVGRDGKSGGGADVVFEKKEGGKACGLDVFFVCCRNSAD